MRTLDLRRQTAVLRKAELTMHEQMCHFLNLKEGEGLVTLIRLCRTLITEADAMRATSNEEVIYLSSNQAYKELSRVVRRFRYGIQVNAVVNRRRPAGPSFSYDCVDLSALGNKGGLQAQALEGFWAPRILKMMQSGELSALRICKFEEQSHKGNARKAAKACGKWFYATRKNHDFCSVKCRRKAFETTDAYRNARAEYMKARYYDEDTIA